VLCENEVVGRLLDDERCVTFNGIQQLIGEEPLVHPLVTERNIGRRLVPSGRPELGILVASAILSMAIGFYNPDNAMYAYFLNLAAPFFRRWTEHVR
jgi:hypothetical protein